MTNITHIPAACSTTGFSPGFTPTHSSPRSSVIVDVTPATRGRTIPARLRAVARAIWRLLPARSTSTPSHQALDSLSPSDRLGERR